MKSLRSIVATLVLGGALFWAPTLALFPPTTSDKVWLIAGSLVSPAVLLAFCSVALRLRRGSVSGPSTCLFALVGVWLTGPWLMTLAAVLRTPHIVRSMGPADYSYLALMSVFPPYTLYVSAAQGSAYGLVLATVLMPICHRVFEKQRWLIPPGWKRHIHFYRGRSTC
jgi:hypothetical protein